MLSVVHSLPNFHSFLSPISHRHGELGPFNPSLPWLLSLLSFQVGYALPDPTSSTAESRLGNRGSGVGGTRTKSFRLQIILRLRLRCPDLTHPWPTDVTNVWRSTTTGRPLVWNSLYKCVRDNSVRPYRKVSVYNWCINIVQVVQNNFPYYCMI